MRQMDRHALRLPPIKLLAKWEKSSRRSGKKRVRLGPDAAQSQPYKEA